MILVLATLMVLSMVVFVFIKQLAVVTDNSVVSSMQEISRHDVKNIQSELDNAWNDLSSIYERTTVTKCSNVQEVCRRLNLEQISNIFNTIYMIDSNGNTYSSANMIKNEREKPYVKSMLTGKEKTVMRYDTMDALEARTQNLVYSVQCEPFEVENIRFIGIIGFSKISLMAQRLKIDSFDGDRKSVV